MILPTVEGSALPFNMPSKSFSELGLPKAVHDNLISASGGDKPTTLDTFAGPLVIAGRDVALIGAAPGGDEQVAPLMAPLIAQMIKSSTRKSNGEHAPPNGGGGGTPRALIVAPSRELVTYAARSARTLLAGTAFRVVHACGGTTIDASAAECGNRVDLLVATPGRLLDLRERGAVALGAVKHLLIVAADALFDAGFDEHMRRLILEEGLPPLLDRQTAVSCALLSPAVERVVSHLLRPNMVKLTAVKPWLAAACAPLARQAVRFAEDRGKQPALAALLEQSGVSSKASGDRDGAPARGPSSGLTLVVVGTRRHCEAVLYFLQGEGFAAGACPSDRPKRAEKEALLSSFASGKIRVLVATDAALRVLEEELCPVAHVISFDSPPSMGDYVRRLSHTACGGHTGRLTTLVTDTTPKVWRILPACPRR